MAVDSRNKRASATNLPFMPVYPKPLAGITAADRIMSAGEYLIHPWKSADSVLLDTDWTDSDKAHDNNTTTYAVNTTDTLFTELQLTFSPAIQTDLVRFWAEGFTNPDTFNPDITVSLWYDDNWNVLWNGSITKSTWYEYPPGGSKWVSKISIIDNESGYDYLRVYELQVLNLNAFVPDSKMPKVDGGLASRSPLMGGALAR